MPAGDKPRVVILGSGPNRIGQGIEFDYCCVHAVQTFRALGYEAIMVNCNPETVSTDYDTSDRLYFEPLSPEEVLAVLDRERPVGVVTQFGGQTPLRLARRIEQAGYKIMGTPHAAIDLAEDRELFGALAGEIGIRCPPWATVEGADEAVAAAEEIGYPVLVRPSYVLGGRAMRVCYDDEPARRRWRRSPAGARRPLRRERDRDRRRRAVRRRGGLHRRGDAARRGGGRSLGRLVVRASRAVAHARERARGRAHRQAARAGARGRRAAQRPARDRGLDGVRPRGEPARLADGAVRRKAIGINLVEAACKLAAGQTLRELALPPSRPTEVSVKAAVLPFARFPGADPVLGPEMRSTGEVMASASDLPTALAKAERAAGRPLPTSGTAFLSVRDADKPGSRRSRLRSPASASRSSRPSGTARTLRAAGLEVEEIEKVADAGDGEPTVVDLIRRRPLRSRRQHAAGLRRAGGRLPDPRGGAHRTRSVHHDGRGRRGRRARDRERACRGDAVAAGAHRRPVRRCRGR